MSGTRLGAIITVIGVLAPSPALPEPQPTLAVWWVDAAGDLKDRLLRRGERTMKAELAALFEGANVPVRYLEEPPSGPLAHDGATVVVVVLTDAAPESWGLPAGALGAVMGRDGPLHCVYVFSQPVKRLIGWSAARTAGAFHRLGLAVARVAAHEIVHSIAPERPHTTTGLMRAELTRASLLDRDLNISSETRSALARR